MSTSITIDRLVKSFGGAGQAAVAGVSLEIGTGELFFLLGPSGCGKTTLLRMIAGFIEPTEGRVLFGTRDVTHLPPNKRNTGMVFQSYALWPHMTVEANVRFGLEIRKAPKEEQGRRAREALAQVRMEAYAERKPNQLSGGQQQRVALARALVIRPDVLLLDEPLSNLDARLRVELRSEIRRVCKESGITTVYVTHDQKEALSMADRVAILDRGRVVQVGGPGELYRMPRNRFVAEFLGETNLLEARGAGAGVLQTAVGTLRALGAADGETGMVSIRPEAVKLMREGSGTLAARIESTTYLGEIAQHTLAFDSGAKLVAAELNPGAGRAVGGRVGVEIAPEDVWRLADA